MKNVASVLCAMATFACLGEGFTIYNVTAFSPGRESVAAADAIELKRRTGVDMALYSLTLHPEGKPAISKAERYVESFCQFQKAVEGSGVRAGVLVQAILGHWRRLDRDVEDWTRTIDSAGREVRFCPEDPLFADYITKVFTMIAKCRPAFILTDDDVRGYSHNAECFCKRHMEMFNSRRGTSYTADELRARLAKARQDDPDYVAFLALQRATIEGVLKRARAAIDAVDPTIPGGICIAGEEHWLCAPLARAMAAKGQKPIMRTSTASYMERMTSANVPYTVCRMLGFAEYYRGWGIDLLCESDTFPHNLWSKSARSFMTHVSNAAFAGMRGSKAWYVNAHKGRFPVSRNYTDILAENPGFLAALSDEVQGSEWQGFAVPCFTNTTNWHLVNNHGEFFLERENAASASFGVLGIPFQTVRDLDGDHTYALAYASEVARLSDGDLKRMLSRRVMLFRDAAVALSARGFDALTGVKTVKKDLFFNREHDDLLDADLTYSKSPSGDYAFETRKGAQVLATLGYRPYSGSPQYEPATPSAVLYENALGGRVLTLQYRPDMISYQRYSEARRASILAMLEKLGGEMPFVAAHDQDILVLVRRKKNGVWLVLVENLNSDPVKQLALHAPEGEFAVERLMGDGKWKRVAASRNGDRLVCDVPVAFYEAVALRLSPTVSGQKAGSCSGKSLEPSAPPPYPGIESWGFRKELALPEALAPAPTNGVRFVRGKVAGYESYRMDVAQDGKVTITTEDDEGLRRAVYHYQDCVRAGDLRSCVRKPWVRNRISRCFFGPIKRPPLNHDELMDDVDYYPEAYLDRLAHEGINGLWLTVEWRDLAATSFARRSPDADRRLDKLRRTVDRCLKYGIKTWIFCIEPRATSTTDPLYLEHREMFGPPRHDGRALVCTATPEGQRYIEESVKDIFTRVPKLGGMIMIAHGERPTTCLSPVDPVTGARSEDGFCERCSKLEPWQIYRNTTDAIMRGIRGAGSSAEYISWFYQPQVVPERGAWVAECARHVPEGVTLAYNFESGAIKEQMGRFRNGGDYWLSFVGPASGFKSVAEAGALAGCRIGAKIQVGNSHEVATVPFVPVPGLLYRKYRAMKAAGVSTVLQCWYFGNYPGVMNKAAGELSFDDFQEDEGTFLKRLAAPYWGKDAELVADVWKRLSDAYAEYPLSNDMQYYGPFHAGPAWPLYADVRLLPLGRTWKPQDAPSGDTIGEALENHTIEEAATLAGRMAEGVALRDGQGRSILDELAGRWKGDKERMRDIGVMKALACQFASGRNIFSFYLERARAIYESRERGNAAAALASLKRMDALVSAEESVTAELLPLAKDDSRLGFHSEAEAHQYHPAKLEWRLGELKKTHARIGEISAAVGGGGAYPESAFERAAPSCRVGEWMDIKGDRSFRISDEPDGGLTVEVRFGRSGSIRMDTIDAAGVSWYKGVTVHSDGRVIPLVWRNRVSPDHEVVAASVRKEGGGTVVKFTLSPLAWGGRMDRRPGWVQFMDGFSPVWPGLPRTTEYRLNLGPLCANLFGRILR